ncbi:hypothetical protein [Nonomuraea sp. KM90]|uniref:hypothetical protein n=1 Tax=Nonomuraea sp. KM90 TaxID=3457428 RepID=UPI003FCEE284
MNSAIGTLAALSAAATLSPLLATPAANAAAPAPATVVTQAPAASAASAAVATAATSAASAAVATAATSAAAGTGGAAGAAATAGASACRLAANIYRRGNTRYQIGAGASGCGRGLYAITCRPLHRHGFPLPRWHQHGIYSKHQNNAILFLTARIRGTNGDHYKAKCWFYRDNRLLGTRTTHTIEL